MFLLFHQIILIVTHYEKKALINSDPTFQSFTIKKMGFDNPILSLIIGVAYLDPLASLLQQLHKLSFIIGAFILICQDLPS